MFLMSGVWIKGWCAQVPRTVLPCVSAVLAQMKLDYKQCLSNHRSFTQSNNQCKTLARRGD